MWWEGVHGCACLLLQTSRCIHPLSIYFSFCTLLAEDFVRLQAVCKLPSRTPSVLGMNDATMSVDGGMFACQPVEAVWLVAEDDRGRFRKFPKTLNDMVEAKYREWKRIGMPPGFVVAYSWPNSSLTSSADYEITFEDMRQKNIATDTSRPVERFLGT